MAEWGKTKVSLGQAMLVIILDEALISPERVCQGCVLADRGGQPRWRDGHLGCGHPMPRSSKGQPECYQCQMGFTLANVE